METAEIQATDYGLEVKKANELMGNLPIIQKERSLLISQYNEICKLNIEDSETSKQARRLRLEIRENRTKGINQWHKATKEVFLRGGQFIDAIKNREIEINEKMESDLEKIEKHFEILEKKRVAELHQKRLDAISQYIDDTSNIQFGSMDEDVWNAYFLAKKTSFVNRLEQEEKEKAERLKKEIEEKKAIEKLKTQAEEKEKELKKQAEILNKEILEKKKIQAELDAKIQAEEKEKELKRLKEEKLKKEPIKKQLKTWVDTFNIEQISVKNNTKTIIEERFKYFKNWAKTEIEKI